MEEQGFTVAVVYDDTFHDYTFFEAKLDFLLSNKKDISLLCTLEGLCHQYSRVRHYFLWDAMLGCPDAAVIFWDGANTETKQWINLYTDMGIPVKVIRYDNIPLIANVVVQKFFPRTAYKTYNNKPINNLKHLNFWIGFLQDKGLKVIDLRYEFKIED